MENDIPKIDLPQDWVIGKLTAGDIGLLNLYANYPCRLKAGIFVLCLGGFHQPDAVQGRTGKFYHDLTG